MGDLHDRASRSLVPASGPADRPGPPPAGADPLSDVLDTIRLRGALFFVWEPGWPYATGVPDGTAFGGLLLPGAEQIVSYHVVTEGPCWAAVADAEPVRLDHGDVLLLPHGDAYCIASRPTPPDPGDATEALAFFRAMAAGEIPPVVVDGGPGPGHNRLICGFLGCDRQPFNPLLESLPRLVRLPAQAGGDPLAALIDFALDASRGGHPGGRCLLLRLSEVMFVEVLRRYLRTAPDTGAGWLAGLRDPLVGRALQRLHGDLAHPWTVERLATGLATSRSTLAERFAAIVGEPPMQYLARWRMQAAARRLSDGHDKVHVVARAVGYESEAAFSRAFKRVVGVAPRDWRNRAARRASQSPA